MLVIRLSRGGTKNKSFYRIVVTENAKKLIGKYVEILGFWNPKEKLLKYDKDKLSAWIKKGAQPSPKIKELISEQPSK